MVQDARHPKGIRSAAHVRKACDYLAERNIEITTSEVGRLCEATGPKEQSIRNNSRLRSYVDARRNEQSRQVYSRPKAVPYESTDLQANAQIHALDIELRRERSQKENLKKALQDADEYDLEATMRTQRLVRIKKASTIADIDLRKLANRILDADHLRRFGMILQGDRVIGVDRNNRIFLEKEEVLQLKAILGGAKFSEDY